MSEGRPVRRTGAGRPGPEAAFTGAPVTGAHVTLPVSAARSVSTAPTERRTLR